MAACEMCGKSMETLQKAKIEGTVLELCPGCAKFGEIVRRPYISSKNIPQPRRQMVPRRKEILEAITEDYAKKVRDAREKMGLTQEEFAKRLNEKHSIMQKIEGGQFTPSIDQARKLERLLKIELVEEIGEGGEIPIAKQTKSDDDGFTMSDFIKVRKKQ
ncbi:multiprotein bridging factor aMBF1 [Nanoarchaeota archaeon]